MQEGLNKPFTGHLITLGRQDISATYDEVVQLAKKIAYPLHPVPEIAYSEKPGMREERFLSDRTLFGLLGFKEMKSMDASNYENADIVFDLNQSELPMELRGAFEIVLDPGTIEHVFHVPNSMKNIFQLLSIGGRVIHTSPSSNHLDHGFYMFSPTFFQDYYRANKFTVHSLNIIRHKPQPIYPWSISKYTPEKFLPFVYGGLDNSMYAIHCIAFKNPDSTFDQIPQQFHYTQNMWQRQEFAVQINKLKKLVKKSKIIYKICTKLIRIKNKLKLRSLFSEKVLKR